MGMEVVGSGSYKSDSGSIKALQHLDFLGERLVVSGFTGERGASLDPYNIEVDNGIVHFTADVVLLDEDGDGVGNSVDECPQGVTNWSSNGETDTDKDGCRDADEDNDDDNDGIPDDRDECPGYDNSNDMDCDRIPDWEDDSDGDGVVDQDDICPGIDDRLDTDKDEIPDCQDEDDDNDGINDVDDACPLIDQEIDWNCNGINDLQDDSDDDGVVDWYDACPLIDQEIDWNCNGINDLQDDSDNDGVVDRYDKCQGSDDAIDRNENQVPDGCEEIEQETEASMNQSEVNESEANQSKVDDGNNGTSTENDDAEKASVPRREHNRLVHVKQHTDHRDRRFNPPHSCGNTPRPHEGERSDARSSTHRCCMGRCIRPATREPGTFFRSKSACHRLLHQPSSGIGSHGRRKNGHS